MSSAPTMPKCLIDVLRSDITASKCEERAAYILIMLAHHNMNQRQAMMRARVVPVLLEVALLGSPLAQKRSLRILQYLRQPVTVASISGPLSTGRIWNKYSTALAFPENDSNITHEMKEHKRAVKTMVQQSLDLNMERIIRRANVTCISGESSKRYKSLVNSSSSKSLPYEVSL